jgi:hypothetical protein
MANIVDEAANRTLRGKTEEDGVDQLLSRSCQMMEVGAKGKRRRAVNALRKNLSGSLQDDSLGKALSTELWDGFLLHLSGKRRACSGDHTPFRASYEFTVQSRRLQTSRSVVHGCSLSWCEEWASRTVTTMHGRLGQKAWRSQWP